MTTDLVLANVDQEKVLATLGLNVRDPNAQAALLVCQRYDLDPLLKHVQLIKQAIYITRDGYLHVAHQSGVFDGMTLDDEGETDTYYWATVSVYRKDMSRPFTAKARCRKDEKTFGDPWDMAVTRAERRALKRAFNVAGLVNEGDYDEHEALFDRATGEVHTPQPVAAVAAGPSMDAPLPDEPLQGEVVDDVITGPQMKKMQALFAEMGITDAQAKRDECGRILGRTVESAGKLSVGEASKIIDALDAPVSA